MTVFFFIVATLLVILLSIVYSYLFFKYNKCLYNYWHLIHNFEKFEKEDASQNLFIKYGALQTIQAVVDAAVTNLLNEPSLAPVFAVVNQPGHRSGVALKACLDLQFAALFGGPFVYPSKTFTRGVVVDARSMKASHCHLNITQDQFNTFVNVLVETLLDAGVTQDDVNMLAPALKNMAKDIVNVQE